MNDNDDVPSTPQEWRALRTASMNAAYEAINTNLTNLAAVLPEEWVDEKLNFAKAGLDLDDYVQILGNGNVALGMYIRALEQNPQMLPDDHGSDRKEIGRCFEDITGTIEALGKLLPAEPVPEGFAARIQKGEARPSPAEGGGVTVEVAETEGKKPKVKKRDQSYHLPGLYERTIRATIALLQEYALKAAPLVGVTADYRRMNSEPNPEQRVVEMQEFSIERNTSSPAHFGTPAAWTRKLAFHFTLNEEPGQVAGRIPG